MKHICSLARAFCRRLHESHWAPGGYLLLCLCKGGPWAGPRGEAPKSSLDCRVWIYKLRPWLRNSPFTGSCWGPASPSRLPASFAGMWPVVPCLKSGPLCPQDAHLPTVVSSPPGTWGAGAASSQWLMAPFRRGGWAMNGPPAAQPHLLNGS